MYAIRSYYDFHAQYNRSNPNETSDYTIIDKVEGKGQFVGVYLAWGVNNNGWWGEGEIKFFIDGDTKFPTISVAKKYPIGKTVFYQPGG